MVTRTQMESEVIIMTTTAERTLGKGERMEVENFLILMQKLTDEEQHAFYNALEGAAIISGLLRESNEKAAG